MEMVGLCVAAGRAPTGRGRGEVSGDSWGVDGFLKRGQGVGSGGSGIGGVLKAGLVGLGMFKF